MALSGRQEAFIAAYLGPAHMVGLQAAKMAGYRGTDHTLTVTVTDLLANPGIKVAIDAGRARIRAEGIASLEARVQAQNARWLGLVAKLTPPEDSTLAWHPDPALLSELRQLEQHTAKELGQWTEKAEVGGKGGGPLRIVVDYADPDAAPSGAMTDTDVVGLGRE